MLYTVHTSFSARDPETGYIRGYSVTEKIDAPDKFTAKTLAWYHIVDGGEYSSFAKLKAQNARVSSRKSEMGRCMKEKLLDEIERELGEEEAKRIVEDIAQLLAQHELTRNPALCDKLFRYMSAVGSGWDS